MTASRPRVLVFAVHPAPYMDSTFSEVARRGNAEIHVKYLFETNCEQQYLQQGIALQYDAQILRGGRQVPDRSSHDLTTVGHLIDQYKPDVVFVAGYVHGTDRKSTRLNSSHANISY